MPASVRRIESGIGRWSQLTPAKSPAGTQPDGGILAEDLREGP
jgi:hypothetical protein